MISDRIARHFLTSWTDRRDVEDLIAVLRPNWLVLRPWELDALQKKFPGVAAMYKVDRVFELAGAPEAQLNADGGSTVSFAGLVEADVDEKFIVLKRLPVSGPGATS